MAAWSECEWRDTFSGGEPGTTEVAKKEGEKEEKNGWNGRRGEEREG